MSRLGMTSAMRVDDEPNIVALLVNHGVTQSEAEAFIKDHGESRAWLWLRTCKQCRGQGACDAG